jgi:serine/threonine protein phosphatase PrpC
MTESTQPGGPSATDGVRLRYAAVSDVGRHRKDNQDSGYASGRLLVVADGVGGQAYGDVASATAIQLLRRLDTPEAQAADTGEDEALTALAGAVVKVHDRLAEMVEQDSELEGTSTTLTAALLEGRRVGVAHVGDSRAYLLRDGTLRQVTADHTFVQTLVDEGRITEEESRVHPHRNIILRAVDGVHQAEPDLFYLDVEPGDRLMLCSDGCSGALTDEQIAEHLGEGTVDSAALGLVQAALDHGSTDNVTVIAAEVVDAATPDDPESAAAGVGPMLVGAAAAQPRRGVLSRFRSRPHDTGEIEAVPAEVVDPEELRYAPRAPSGRRAARRLLLLLLPLAILVGLLWAGYSWSQEQYYVAEDGDAVAIYRGVQVDLPLVSLSSVEEGTDLALEDLTSYNRGLVEDGIQAESITGARKIVANLARDKEQSDCPTTSPSPTRSPQASRSPRGTASPRPSTSPSASPSGDALVPEGCPSTTPAPASPSGSPTGSAPAAGGGGA